MTKAMEVVVIGRKPNVCQSFFASGRNISKMRPPVGKKGSKSENKPIGNVGKTPHLQRSTGEPEYRWSNRSSSRFDGCQKPASGTSFK